MFLALIILSNILQASDVERTGVSFNGEVRMGQNFEKEFGNGLVFILRASKDPQTPGWTIEIRPHGESSPSEMEFSWVATPPYRFFNPRYLEVSYGYSAEEIVAMNRREFQFVLDRSSYERASDAVRTLLWPAGNTQEVLEKAEKTLQEARLCRGVLRILDSRVTSISGTDALIDCLKFEVELCS